MCPCKYCLNLESIPVATKQNGGLSVYCLRQYFRFTMPVDFHRPTAVAPVSQLTSDVIQSAPPKFLQKTSDSTENKGYLVASFKNFTDSPIIPKLS
ncbi:hypothetical protein NUACC26_087600 [Scytonema sp. NUACC26]